MLNKLIAKFIDMLAIRIAFYLIDQNEITAWAKINQGTIRRAKAVAALQGKSLTIKEIYDNYTKKELQ